MPSTVDSSGPSAHCRVNSLLIAWTPEQLRALPGITEKARQNGYARIRPVPADELYQREPHLGPGALAALEIAIKEAPERGWRSALVIGLLAAFAVSTAAFIRRTLRSPAPLVELRTFRQRNFAIGCALSFVLGMGLYGSVYLMPVFLTYVRGHNALQIGRQRGDG